MYYHKRAHVGLEASKMKKKKLIQVAPYRNPKLTQFVFEQNIREEPLLTALHLLYYCWLHCGLHCGLSAQWVYNVIWTGMLSATLCHSCAEQWEKPLLRRKGCKAGTKLDFSPLCTLLYTAAALAHCMQCNLLWGERQQENWWMQHPPIGSSSWVAKILTRCTSLRAIAIIWQL